MNITDKQFRKLISGIKIPEGFSGEYVEDSWAGMKRLTYVLKTDKIKFTFRTHGACSTEFEAEGSWCSFDRTGVSSSFYIEKDTKNLDEILAEQLDLINKQVEYYKTAVTVPGLPRRWTVAPDGVKALQDRLKKNGHITFTPSGFGTGYLVTKRPQRGMRYGEERAKPELEKFLGHSPLYVSTMDCD